MRCSRSCCRRAAAPPHWPLLAVFFMPKVGRVWVIAGLGRRWTTRLIVCPGAGLVTSGLYRLLSHPNYLIVIGELAILPLAFDALPIAVGFSACNAVVLLRRVRLERAALGWGTDLRALLSSPGSCFGYQRRAPPARRRWVRLEGLWGGVGTDRHNASRHSAFDPEADSRQAVGIVGGRKRDLRAGELSFEMSRHRFITLGS